MLPLVGKVAATMAGKSVASTAGTSFLASLGQMAGSQLIGQAFQSPQQQQGNSFGLAPSQRRQNLSLSGGVYGYPGWQTTQPSLYDSPIMRAYFGG